MKKKARFWSFILSLFLLVSALSAPAHAGPTAAEITGEIERLTLNDPADVYSGGVMIIAGSQVILPKNLLIDLPANRLSLQQIFDQAPALCKANGESGLAKADRCNASGTGGFATLSGVHSTAGNIIAADVLIEKGKDVAFGVVSYINYTDGYFRVNGIPGDPATGVMVRLNDPTSRHTIQQGLGCTTSGPAFPNCSADPRFTLDPDNYVIAFSTGYPVCIPSTVARSFTNTLGGGPSTSQANASGTGDFLCPDSNRTAALVEPPVNDSRLFAPLVVGDSVNAEGNYEAIGGVRFLSAHTMRVNKALSTKNVAGQPDYMFLEEVFVEAPGFQNQRARALIIGFTTLAPTDVDLWTLHRDPTSNAVHEFPLASVKGCDAANGVGTCSGQGLIGAGANIFRIRYDVDFLLAASGTPGGASPKLSPCAQLRASTRFAVSNPGLCPGGTAAEFANNFAILSPIPHEIQARTGHRLDSTVPLITLDINGNPATNGQYLFPFGINLGGVETADFLEVDINLLTTPRAFEGIPWNLDRRLSPSGCLKATGCEAAPQPLDPFPFTGLDPRTQADFTVIGLGTGGTPKGTYNDPNFTASALGNASNRVFSFVSSTGKFNGNTTLLACGTGLFPALCPPDPALIAINPTPILAIFPPITDEDSAVTTTGTAVTINVLANDIPVFGTIDPASVKIAATPGSGTATVNADGSITYTPTATFTAGLVTFTYTVANNFGAVSLPGTVVVIIHAPPVANSDIATVPARSTVTINLLSNDTVTTSALNPASVNTVSNPSCGSLVNLLNGTVVFTAPVAVPAAPGTCAFSYVVSDSFSVPALSNVATVTVTITPAIVPVANDDPAATTTGSTVNINVVANDTSATSTINPATVSVTAPTGAIAPNTFSGTAAANLDGTVAYTAPATPGTYTFTYTVKDNAVSPATSSPASVTVTVTAPLQASGVTMTPNLASPQNIGTPITFTAAGIPGTGVYEYRFSLFSGGAWAVVQAYSTTPTWTWTPASAGTYAIAVEVRNAGSTVDRDAITTTAYVITAPTAATGVSLFQDKSSPQIAGTPITFAAAGAGGSGSYEYRYSLFSGGAWTVTQAYSTTPTWTWTPIASGVYAVAVEVRNAGTTVDRDAITTMVYVITAPTPATGVSLFHNLDSPQIAGTPVTFAAAGIGGTGSYEYQFLVFDGAAWTVTRLFSTDSTWTWTPAVPGNYLISVEVRNAGSTVPRDAVSGNLNYIIN